MAQRGINLDKVEENLPEGILIDWGATADYEDDDGVVSMVFFHCLRCDEMTLEQPSCHCEEVYG